MVRESGERSRDGEAAAGYDDENDGDFSFSELAPTSVRPPLTVRLDVLIAMPWCPPSCSSDAVAAVEVEKRDWADVEMLPRVAPALPYAIAPMIACRSACGTWTMPFEMVCVGAAHTYTTVSCLVSLTEGSNDNVDTHKQHPSASHARASSSATHSKSGRRGRTHKRTPRQAQRSPRRSSHGARPPPRYHSHWLRRTGVNSVLRWTAG